MRDLTISDQIICRAFLFVAIPIVLTILWIMLPIFFVIVWVYSMFAPLKVDHTGKIIVWEKQDGV